MTRQVLLPQVELSMESVTVTAWLVAEGDRVTTGQAIMEVETQKATVEVPAPFDGFIRKLCVKKDQEIGEKALLCLMTDTADEPVQDSSSPSGASAAAAASSATQTTATAAPSPGGPVRATPAARKVANDLKVDIATVRGTGPGGRITVEDVERAASGAKASAPAPTASSAASGGGEWMDIPPTRLALIQQMTQSLAETPQFHTLRQFDVTALMVKAEGVTFTHRLIKALAAALAQHPVLRTVIDGNRTKVQPVSVAVAMDTPHGLLAPVIRNADTLSLAQIAEQTKSFRERGDANKLKRPDLVDGPFAVSNLGMLGVDIFNPFVFKGQTAVLGIGRVMDIAGGRKSVWFSLAVDHRVVDGAEAARFLSTLQQECLRS